MELPGPQPRSIMLDGAVSGILEIRSWTGRVRSLLNLRYWVGDQVVEWEGEVVKCFVGWSLLGFVDGGMAIGLSWCVKHLGMLRVICCIVSVFLELVTKFLIESD